VRALGDEVGLAQRGRAVRDALDCGNHLAQGDGVGAGLEHGAGELVAERFHLCLGHCADLRVEPFDQPEQRRFAGCRSGRCKAAGAEIEPA
jgi:hypothetical protein